MNHTAQNIIALFARNRDIGFILIINGAIFRYGVKSIKARKQDAHFNIQLAKVIYPLIQSVHSPGVIVIEQIDTDSTAIGAIRHALPGILSRFIGQEYTLMEISLAEVKQSLCRDPDATHQTLCDVIAHRYPTLLPYVKGVRIQKRKYWEKLLMAFALMDVAKHRLEIAQRLKRLRRESNGKSCLNNTTEKKRHNPSFSD